MSVTRERLLVLLTTQSTPAEYQVCAANGSVPLRKTIVVQCYVAGAVLLLSHLIPSLRETDTCMIGDAGTYRRKWSGNAGRGVELRAPIAPSFDH